MAEYKMTLADFLNGRYSELGVKGVYILTDNAAHLYVGQSANVSRRLASHIGFTHRKYSEGLKTGVYSPSPVGWLIRSLAPVSFKWTLQVVKYDSVEHRSLDDLELQYILKLTPYMNSQDNPNKKPFPDYLRRLTLEPYEDDIYDDRTFDPVMQRRLNKRMVRILKRFTRAA